MSFFRRFLARIGYQAKPVVFDDALGVPEVVAARAAAREGDFRRWADAVLACRSVADRDAAIWIVGDRSIPTETVQRWADAAPGDALAQFALCARLVADAWAVRTGKRARHVSDEQFRVFHDLLAVSDERLHAAMQLAPESPTPWSISVACAMGRGLGHETLAYRYEQAVVRGGGTFGAHETYLQAISHKWGGSHDAMFAFARTPAFTAPGAPENALLAQAHLERAYASRGWFAQDTVQAELRAISESAWASPYPEDVAGLSAHNVLAVVLSRAGLRALALRHVAHLRDRFQEFPWVYFPQAHLEAARLQREAIADGLM